MVTPNRAELICKKGVNENGEPLTRLRSVQSITCVAHTVALCAKCFGAANMATGEPLQVGEAVGIIALSQSRRWYTAYNE